MSSAVSERSCSSLADEGNSLQCSDETERCWKMNEGLRETVRLPERRRGCSPMRRSGGGYESEHGGGGGDGDGGINITLHIDPMLFLDFDSMFFSFDFICPPIMLFMSVDLGNYVLSHYDECVDEMESITQSVIQTELAIQIDFSSFHFRCHFDFGYIPFRYLDCV